MQDLALQAAGVLAIVVAIIHGAIAEFRVFAKAQIEPRGTRRLLRMVWQASTIDWIGMAVLLIAAPSIDSPIARRWIIAMAVLVFGYAAIGNAVVSRGRHFGWMLMSAVIALALARL
jgi:hypothetical protein